jgi:hypothetical protein
MVDLTSVREIENVWITLSDGATRRPHLATRGRRVGSRPAILEYIPYRKRD